MATFLDTEITLTAENGMKGPWVIIARAVRGLGTLRVTSDEDCILDVGVGPPAFERTVATAELKARVSKDFLLIDYISRLSLRAQFPNGKKSGHFLVVIK